MRWLLVIAVFACGAPTPVRAPDRDPDTATLVIHAERMVDVTSGAYVPDVLIEIAGDRIARVQRHTSGAGPRGARVIHLAGVATVCGSRRMPKVARRSPRRSRAVLCRSSMAR